ncbi:MAG: polysaccharide biosynthesis/export family protein [Hyphomicrobiaceae bacterium]|nr:polysaccharide biosynthesis/export family protein [Hyphomicrobiaceae bacterium]
MTNIQGSQKRLRCIFALLLSLVVLPTLVVADARPVIAAAANYTLGPLDKIRIRVYQWRASKDEVIEWPALREEFFVGADGNLSLPLIGVTSALGLTTAELSDNIGNLLKERLKLVDAPNTAVEIVQYRPFFIVGNVERPGEYPYRPGLTLLQSVALAGGMKRTNDPGLLRLEREAISGEGEIKTLQTEIDSLLARRARYEAEISLATEIAFPKQLLDRADDAAVRILIDQERLIFDTRRTSVASQLAALQQLKSYLETELESIAGQVHTQQTQISLVRGELDTLKVLESKGLAAAPRLLQLRRLEAQLESERLRLTTAEAKAQQEISKTDIASLDLRNKITNEVANDLRQTQAKLQDLATRAETAARLLYESRVVAPKLLSGQIRNSKKKPIMKIVRVVSGFPTEIVAHEASLVEPGDTVSIEMDDEDQNIPVSMDQFLGSILKSSVKEPPRQELRPPVVQPGKLRRKAVQLDKPAGKQPAVLVSNPGESEHEATREPIGEAIAETRAAHRMAVEMSQRRPSQADRTTPDVATAEPPPTAAAVKPALPVRRHNVIVRRGITTSVNEPPLPTAKPVPDAAIAAQEPRTPRRLNNQWYATRDAARAESYSRHYRRLRSRS